MTDRVAVRQRRKRICDVIGNRSSRLKTSPPAWAGSIRTLYRSSRHFESVFTKFSRNATSNTVGQIFTNGSWYNEGGSPLLTWSDTRKRGGAQPSGIAPPRIVLARQEDGHGRRGSDQNSFLNQPWLSLVLPRWISTSAVRSRLATGPATASPMVKSSSRPRTRPIGVITAAVPQAKASVCRP